jgi:hypothetical protein
MNEIKHTPGPWTAKQEYANRWRIEAPNPSGSDFVPISVGIACTTVCEVGCNDENTKGNALHFAAALDMALILEMLAADADAGKVMIPSGLRLSIDAALIKAGRKAAPVPVRHITTAGDAR